MVHLSIHSNVAMADNSVVSAQGSVNARNMCRTTAATVGEIQTNLYIKGEQKNLSNFVT